MPYALITGASKGIGKAIAYELAGRGYDLLLVSRSEKNLSAASEHITAKTGVKVKTFAIDLSHPGAAKSLYEWCTGNKFEINVLVNNAGYGMWGMFETMLLQDQLNMMQLNVNAMVELSHYFIPVLKNNISSYILNVSSTAAFQAVPAMTVYSATKVFVITFTRGLQYELRQSNISVSCLIPGTTDTSFMDRAHMEPLKEVAKKFEMKPEEVARIAVDGMLNKTLEIIPGFTNKASAVGTKFLPKRLAENIAASLYLKKLKKYLG